MSHIQNTYSNSQEHRWRDVKNTFTSAVAGVNLGNNTRRDQVKLHSNKGFATIPTAIESLSRVTDMSSLLQAANHLDKFRRSLSDLYNFPTTLKSSPEGQVVESNGNTVAANFNTAIDQVRKVEEELNNAWLDHYANIRPGPPIVRRGSSAETVGWRSSGRNLWTTMKGPIREKQLFKSRTFLLTPVAIDFDRNWMTREMEETGLGKRDQDSI